MPIPDNSQWMGITGQPERSLWVPIEAWDAFLNQLKTVVSNPAPIKNLIRARVSALTGAYGFDSDAETDEWILEVCALCVSPHGPLTREEFLLIEAEFSGG